MGSRHPTSALPPRRQLYESTYIDFAENQLSPGLISLSLLSTPHPRILPHSPVRSSRSPKALSTWRWKARLASGRTPPIHRKERKNPYRIRSRENPFFENQERSLCKLGFPPASTFGLKPWFFFVQVNLHSLTHYAKGTPSPCLAPTV